MQWCIYFFYPLQQLKLSLRYLGHISWRILLYTRIPLNLPNEVLESDSSLLTQFLKCQTLRSVQVVYRIGYLLFFFADVDTFCFFLSRVYGLPWENHGRNLSSAPAEGGRPPSRKVSFSCWGCCENERCDQRFYRRGTWFSLFYFSSDEFSPDLSGVYPAQFSLLHWKRKIGEESDPQVLFLKAELIVLFLYFVFLRSADVWISSSRFVVSIPDLHTVHCFRRSWTHAFDCEHIFHLVFASWRSSWTRNDHWEGWGFRRMDRLWRQVEPWDFWIRKVESML